MRRGQSSRVILTDMTSAATQGPEIRPLQTAPTDSTAVQDVGGPSSLTKPIRLRIEIPGKIVTRKLASPITHSSHGDRRRSIGLGPPQNSGPRAFGLTSTVVTGGQSQRSIGSYPYTSSGGDLGVSTEAYRLRGSSEAQRESTSEGSPERLANVVFQL